MSPILVRPVREQLEHDRIMRLLQARLKRRGDVIANFGTDQTAPVKIGQMQLYPDLVIVATDKGRKLLGTVEVETAESVNHLEAMAQWAHLGKAKAPFHLYVPAGSAESARRLVGENAVNAAEIWTYHTIGDQTRFTMIHRSANAAPAEPAKPAAPAAPRRAASPAPKRAAAKRGTTTRAAAARKTAASATRKSAVRTSRTKPAARKTTARAQKRK